MPRKIRELFAREVIDSRGFPTVEVEIGLEDGHCGRGIVPSGASTGIHEALELRDGDTKRFLGKGVLRAISNVENRIRPQLINKSFVSIRDVDNALLSLDSTPQKTELGANAILAVSMAYAHALAREARRPLFEILGEAMGARTPSLPVPLMNIINGGLHANNGLEFQEFMIVPHGFVSFKEALRAGCEVFQTLKKILGDRGNSTAVGDEGGFAPRLESNDLAIQLILEAIQKAGYHPRTEVALALDVAATSFQKGSDRYQVRVGQESDIHRDVLINYYARLIDNYPIVSIEDGLGEEDWSGWQTMTGRLGSSIQLVGDDLFVTQSTHLQRGIKCAAANAILIKVNQVGTLSETFDTLRLAEKHGYRRIVSHRSGETEDTTIAHLAVGSGAGQIKTGSLSRGERTAKYNELLRIEERAQRAGKPLRFVSPFF